MENHPERSEESASALEPRTKRTHGKRTETDKILLEIVTPTGRALSVQADEVTAPSVDGEFGVMPGHLPLLAALQTGLITYRVGGETKKCAVGPGFAEAGPNKVSVLTDDFIERDQIDPVVVRKDLAEVQTQNRSASREAAGAGRQGRGRCSRT